MARVRFINSDGAGFADLVTVNDNMTVEQFLASKGIDPKKYIIRHNRQECVIETDTLKDGDRLSAVPAGKVGGGEVLKEGDKVSVTPRNIAGAEEAQALVEALTSRYFRD